MGLDVYLYKYENKADTDKRKAEYETASEANWNNAGDYSSLTDSQKEEVSAKNKAVADSLGLGDWGSDEKLKTKIEFDSKTDPEHYFKVGYLRSSYNGGGINRVLENLGVPGLYEIFEAGDEYCFQPNWEGALSRCVHAIELLKSKGNYRVFTVSENIFGSPNLPQNENEALAAFLEQIGKESAFDDSGYSTRSGHFYPKTPLKVFGLLPGQSNILKKQSCAYVVCEGENEWYIKALQITKETIEYVLAQPDKEKYWLHWSS